MLKMHESVPLLAKNFVTNIFKDNDKITIEEFNQNFEEYYSWLTPSLTCLRVLEISEIKVRHRTIKEIKR